MEKEAALEQTLKPNWGGAKVVPKAIGYYRCNARNCNVMGYRGASLI